MTHLFYDGDCGLCQGAVRFVSHRDHSDSIRFAPLGGKTFLDLIPPDRRAGLPDSLLVLTPEGDLMTRSGALIHLLRRMGPGWRRVGTLLAWLPASLRDAGYRLMARLRRTRRACAVSMSTQDKRFRP